MDESPPVMPRFSTTMTLAPARDASTAQLMPAMPEPMTTMSQSLVSLASAGVAATA